MSDTYRDPSEPSSARLDRLEESVKRGRVERLAKMFQIGITAVLIGASLSGFVAAVTYTQTSRNRDESLRLAAQTTADADARDEAAMMCSTACEANGMSLERVHAQGPRAAACWCASPTRRRELWNDLRSPDTALRAQCTEACAGVGATVSRAILRPHVERTYDSYRQTYTAARPGRVLACSCNTPTSHRVLWDDRR